MQVQSCNPLKVMQKSSGDGIGRHRGLKILGLMAVGVQVPPGVNGEPLEYSGGFSIMEAQK